MYTCVSLSLSLSIYIYIHVLYIHITWRLRARRANLKVHPVSITRFPLRKFSPGAGLLRNRFVHR